MDYEYNEGESSSKRKQPQEASLPFREEEHDDAAAEAAANSTSVSYGVSFQQGPAAVAKPANSDLFYECARKYTDTCFIEK